MTRQPAFYAHDGSRLAAYALLPAAVIYDAAARLRFRLTSPRRAGVPVICVGNPTLGGAGKTPVAIAIAERLKAMGRSPMGSSSRPVRCGCHSPISAPAPML